MQVRILDRVLRGIGGRQSHRDDEVGRRESQKNQDEQLASPSMKQVLQHRDRTLTRVGSLRYLCIDRKRAQKRDADQQERCEWRQGASRKQRDPRLITQRGEIVHAREPENRVPGMSFVMLILFKAAPPVKPPRQARSWRGSARNRERLRRAGNRTRFGHFRQDSTAVRFCRRGLMTAPAQAFYLINSFTRGEIASAQIL